MYDSFWLGVSMTLFARVATFRMMRWPLTSSPLSLFPQLIGGGILWSMFDVGRRMGIEEMLKLYQANQFNKQLRKDGKHYDL